jgi:hypothetical protein
MKGLIKRRYANCDTSPLIPEIEVGAQDYNRMLIDGDPIFSKVNFTTGSKVKIVSRPALVSYSLVAVVRYSKQVQASLYQIGLEKVESNES